MTEIKPANLATSAPASEIRVKPSTTQQIAQLTQAQQQERARFALWLLICTNNPYLVKSATGDFEFTFPSSPPSETENAVYTVLSTMLINVSPDPVTAMKKFLDHLLLHTKKAAPEIATFGDAIQVVRSLYASTGDFYTPGGICDDIVNITGIVG